MTRSKLSMLQDLFEDNILTWQHFFFIEKHVMLFFLKITWFCVPMVILLEYQVFCVINMKISHVWNLILFKGQNYH